MVQRILASPAATELIGRLKQVYPELMFHQSGGCCDGSSPMCFEKGEFKLGEVDVCLGTIDGCEFWMSRDQFEYWKHTQLTLDTTKGRGGGFSLEVPTGFRFMIHSRVFRESEYIDLEEVHFFSE